MRRVKGGDGMRERVVLLTGLVAAWVAGMGDMVHAAWALPVSLVAAFYTGAAAVWLLKRLAG